MPQVLLDGRIAASGWNAVHTLRTHLLLLRIVRICMTLFDHAHSQLLQLVKVVGRVRDHIGLDAKERQIFYNRILKFLLFLTWICIVESHDETALVGLGKVLVEDRSLRMADVQVATRLRWEPRHDLALLGTLQEKVKACRRLLVLEHVTLCLVHSCHGPRKGW